ncbi:Peroxidasin [Araneus ventricosus]|uniref:Peroxidasin n=1 Tax=Araneus ventricosus TaxID=182803 RepID=A0A4Y2H1S0_ARAVE|nr:Peroxidasin [Araneus ventricosus]
MTRRLPRSKLHISKRLKWAHNHIPYCDKWMAVLFSDDKKWNLDGPDRNIKYWHDLRKEPRSFFSRQSGGGSVMVWVTFGLNGQVGLAFLGGRQNYTETLENHLMPFAENIGGQNWRLDSNALICDCEIMWLAEMLKEKQGVTQAAVTCEHPVTLQGKQLMALSNEDLRCKRPKLTEEPNDVDVSFGGTAYFTCRADGDPKPDIVWLHNSNEILPEQDERYSILDDGTLMITEAQDLDEGVYECMAKNPAGEIKSRAAKMHYLKLKENKGILTFKEQPVDSRVPVGSTIVLPCGAVGDPDPTIHWTQNGIALPRVFRYHVSSTGTLTIKNVQKNDAGVYRCVATNQVSTIAVESKIDVEAPPVFLERPRDQEALQGNSVELICLVEGLPPPVLSWSKDGSPVHIGNKFKVLKDGTHFRIEEVREEDTGIYTCHAENESGQRNSSAFVMIRRNVPPVFSRVPEDQRIEMGSSLELPCHAKGQPMPHIKWRKNGSILGAESDHHRINIHGDLYMFNIQRDDDGIYECIAENDVGRASVSMRLTVADNIDLWVGGISEDSVRGAKVGPTFLCLLIDQFKRVRDGDRFWYENPGIFSPDQLHQIKQSSLARVICDNGDNITTLTEDVFTVPHHQSPSFRPCSTLPRVELSVWTECCQECSASSDNNEINSIGVRTRRSFVDRYNNDRDQTFNDSPRNVSHHINDDEFDITEQRIEGIEELVGKLDKTVQRLSRKVRKLETEYKLRKDGHCIDTVGNKRKSGETWQSDKCSKCSCEDSQITCWVEKCPPSQCKNPRFIEGECCPVC